MSDDDAPEIIGTAAAALILDRSTFWVKTEAKKGRLPVHSKMPGTTGAYLFMRSDIERIAAERGAA